MPGKELEFENGDAVDADDVPAGFVEVVEADEEHLEEVKTRLSEP